MKTKIAALALGALTIAGAVSTTTNQAEAQWRRGGLGFGIAAGFIAGAAIASAASARPVYVTGGYRRCGWVNQIDAYGFVRSVRVCNVYY
jgi:hypothetical protein